MGANSSSRMCRDQGTIHQAHIAQLERIQVAALLPGAEKEGLELLGLGCVEENGPLLNSRASCINHTRVRSSDHDRILILSGLPRQSPARNYSPLSQNTRPSIKSPTQPLVRCRWRTEQKLALLVRIFTKGELELTRIWELKPSGQYSKQTVQLQAQKM